VSEVHHHALDSISYTIRAANEKALQRPKITWHGGEASSNPGAVIYKNIWAVAVARFALCLMFTSLPRLSSYRAGCLPGHQTRQVGGKTQKNTQACSAHPRGQGKGERAAKGWR